MNANRIWTILRLWGTTYLFWLGIAALLERGGPITSPERFWSTVLLATVGAIVGVLLVSPAARGEEEEHRE